MIFNIAKSQFKSPFTIFVGIWVLVYVLYLMKFSSRLNLSFFETLVPLVCILGSHFLGFGAATLCFKGKERFEVRITDLLLARLRNAVILAALIFFFEVLYFRYVPFISMLQGGDVSHFDFGIGGLHGLLLALLSSVSTISFLIYIATGDKRYLTPLFFAVSVGVLTVSRKLFMVAFVQCFIVLFMVKSFKGVYHYFFFGACFVILLFGVIGEIRSPNVMQDLGGVDFDVEYWNAGLVWVYLYLTTPFQNICYAILNFSGGDDFMFLNTFSTLIPSFILYDVNSYADSVDKFYYLESNVFNVSTAFIKPYLDLGVLGVSIFSFVVGFLGQAFFRVGGGIVGFVFSVFMCSAGMLSIFSNNYLNPNFIFQYFVVLYVGLPFYFKFK